MQGRQFKRGTEELRVLLGCEWARFPTLLMFTFSEMLRVFFFLTRAALSSHSIPSVKVFTILNIELTWLLHLILTVAGLITGRPARYDLIVATFIKLRHCFSSPALFQNILRLLQVVGRTSSIPNTDAPAKLSSNDLTHPYLILLQLPDWQIIARSNQWSFVSCHCGCMPKTRNLPSRQSDNRWFKLT